MSVFHLAEDLVFLSLADFLMTIEFLPFFLHTCSNIKFSFLFLIINHLISIHFQTLCGVHISFHVICKCLLIQSIVLQSPHTKILYTISHKLYCIQCLSASSYSQIFPPFPSILILLFCS